MQAFSPEIGDLPPPVLFHPKELTISISPKEREIPWNNVYDGLTTSTKDSLRKSQGQSPASGLMCGIVLWPRNRLPVHKEPNTKFIQIS